MYYAFDVLPYGDSFKIIDVAGTAGSGIHQARAAYNRPEAREKAKRYVSSLAEVARGKTVLYGDRSPCFYTIHGITKEARELYRDNPQWKPLLHWRRDAKQSEHRRSERENVGGFNWAVQEQRILYNAARELDVDLVFGREINTIGNEGIVMIFQRRDPDNFKEAETPLPLDSVGLYYHQGESRHIDSHTIIEHNPQTIVVNPLNMDRSMDSKLYFREFARARGFADVFPRSIPVGMGLATYDQSRDFVSELESRENWPAVVLKPAMTCNGWGIRMIGKKDIGKMLKDFCVQSSDPDLEGFVDDSVVLAFWLDCAKEDKCSSYPIGKGRYVFSPGWDLWEGLEKENNGVRKRFEEEWKKIDPKSSDIFAYTPRFFPLFEYASASLEEFIPPGIVRSRKTRETHAGYIRIVVFNKQPVIAMWRLQREPYNGEYQPFVGSNCSTFWEGCDEETEARLIDFLNPVIEGFESEFFSRIRSVNDLFKFRNRYLKRLLKDAR